MERLQERLQERGRTAEGRVRTMSGLLALVAMAGFAGPVVGQHALDRNLQVGSGGINPARPDMAAEMRFRNSIVTGNAPGGLSFRGDVGYLAPGEFSGRLGSDDTFAFRRDTVYSGLGGMGIRGTDALQYQFALTTGLTPPPGLAGAPLGISRGMRGATSDMVRHDLPDLRQETIQPTTAPRWRPGIEVEDTRGMSLAALRTPSAFVTSRTFQPTVLGTTVDAEGVPMGVIASSLRGVSYGPMQPGRDLERPDLQPIPTEIPGLRVPEAADRRLETAIEEPRSPYQELMARIRRAPDERLDPRMGEDPAVAEGEIRGGTLERDWRNRLSDLRLQLQEPARTTSQRLRQGIDQRFDPRMPGMEEEADARAAQRRTFDPESIDMLRRAGEVDVLAPTGFDAYAVHMEAGQRHLAAGRYFDAEDRFTAALSAKPGDPMAAIGRIHSALGAGMFLSASINLREVLTRNPELVGVRYSNELLPGEAQMATAKERLADLIRTRPIQARDAGMLLAYLGYQTGDQATMERGLSAMEAPATEEEPLTPSDEQMIRLASLMRQVWRDADEAREREP